MHASLSRTLLLHMVHRRAKAGGSHVYASDPEAQKKSEVTNLGYTYLA